jgi:hypothetical protein
MSLSTLEALAKWRNVRLVKVLEMYGEEIPEDRRAEWELGLFLDRRPELRDGSEARPWTFWTKRPWRAC